MIEGAREQQATGEPLEGKTPASSQFERVQQVAEAGRHGHILIASSMKYINQAKGLRAESARAFTGRRNSYSGRGEDFLSRQPNVFYGNSCNSGKESRKNNPKVGNELSLRGLQMSN